jgi:uncharacterized cupredoxin-like copper-binding protein
MVQARTPGYRKRPIKGHGIDVKGAIVAKGGVSRVTATLKRGIYEFLCTVDSHAAAGMKGTLTIT